MIVAGSWRSRLIICGALHIDDCLFFAVAVFFAGRDVLGCYCFAGLLDDTLLGMNGGIDVLLCYFWS